MSTIIDEIERMTVLDLVNFKKALEDRWGVLVSNRLPMVTPDSVTPESPAEEQTEFSVTLSGFGANKIAVIKVVRELTSLGLREAKDLVESAPVAVREGVTREDAETAAAKLREAGATAEIM